MSQGNDFANYSSPVDASATPPEDTWYVAVASDDIKQMTLDQLDEAFRLGVVSSKTPVWTEGMEAWSPLGEVADLEGDDGDAAGGETASAAASGSHTSDSHASRSHASDSYAEERAQASIFEAPLAASPLLSSAPSAQSFPPGPGPSSFAPVTSSFGPSASSPLLSSSGPVALEVDENMAPMGRTRRFRIERWLLAAAAIAGVCVTAYNNMDLFAASAASSVASAADTSSGSAFAARPYDVGNAAEPAPAAAPAPSNAEPAAKAAAGEGDAPIGTAAPTAKDQAEAADDVEEEPAAPAAKGKLKNSFAKAFNSSKSAKKASKSSKAARASKAKKSWKRPAAKSAKKSGVPRAASAFDPLNGALP